MGYSTLIPTAGDLSHILQVCGILRVALGSAARDPLQDAQTDPLCSRLALTWTFTRTLLGLCSCPGQRYRPYGSVRAGYAIAFLDGALGSRPGGYRTLAGW